MLLLGTKALRHSVIDFWRTDTKAHMLWNPETLRPSINSRPGIWPASFSKEAACHSAWYPSVASENPGTEKCFTLLTT